MNPKSAFTLVEIMIVVVIIGMLASIAVPSFQMARDKAVESAIKNNLRQIAGAGQRYLLENRATLSVGYGQLIADRYFPEISQVADENYSTLVISDNGTTIAVDYQSTEGRKSITFKY